MSLKQRLITGVVATVTVAGGGAALFALQAPSHEASSIQIVDDARVLDDPVLIDGIEDLRFYEPTNVAVFTTNGGSAARSDDNALNDAVLDQARTRFPQWLSADGQTFADDLFILGVDPEGRLVGTYFGENRSVQQKVQTAIQEAAKPDFRAGRWTDGSLAGVAAAADRMNQPGVRGGSGALPIGAGLAVGIGSAIVYGVGSSRAAKSRRARQAGDASYASVRRAAEQTEAYARLLPEGSRYGGAMLARFEEYRAELRDLTELAGQASSLPSKDDDSPHSLATLERFRDRAATLDGLDDVIAATATLLTKGTGWREVWAHEVAPLRADLHAVPSFLDDTLLEPAVPPEVRALPEVATLRETTAGLEAELDLLRAGLEEGTLSPDEALDRLRAARDTLTVTLDALAAAVAQTLGRTKREQELMADSLSEQRRRASAESTILATSYPTWTWFPVVSLDRGVRSGSSAVEASRVSSASSSGGSSSSFSSGGGFSGSGSSSRF